MTPCKRAEDNGKMNLCSLVLRFINTVSHREGRCAASGKASRPRRTGQVR